MDQLGTQALYAVQLPPELESVVAARRLLTRAVTAWRLRDGVCHDAALAVSELVTNSVLHAGTAVAVRVRRLGAGVRIEVEDGSRHLPVVEAATPEELLSNRSMTGRGLALVAATSDRWGCEPLATGKLIWAEVGTGRAAGPAAPAAPAAAIPAPPAGVTAADRAVPAGAAGGAPGGGTGAGRTVHLIGVPVAVLLESTQQLSDLQREVQVMAMGRTAPPDLEQVLESGRPWITDLDSWTDSDRRFAEWASAAGMETVDFEVVVPDDIAWRIEGLAAWLRRVAAGIMRRRLLTLPASPEVTAYRRWYGEEIMRQISGLAPQPCPVRLRARA